MAVDVGEHIDALAHAGGLLGDAAARASLDAPVPTCPEWTLRDLLRHVGGVHRWAASYIVSPRFEPSTDEEDAEFFAAPGDDELLDWFRFGHAALVAALRAADPGLETWSFLPGAPTPLAFWARRQAHETTIHRVDAERAAARPSGCAPTLAADGIDELLTGFFARPRSRLVSEQPISLAVRPTDMDQAWTIHIVADKRVASRTASDAACTISGAASDLYLFLWNRLGRESLGVTGDVTVLDLWRDRAHVRWS